MVRRLLVSGAPSVSGLASASVILRLGYRVCAGAQLKYSLAGCAGSRLVKVRSWVPCPM